MLQKMSRFLDDGRKIIFISEFPRKFWKFEDANLAVQNFSLFPFHFFNPLINLRPTGTVHEDLIRIEPVEIPGVPRAPGSPWLRPTGRPRTAGAEPDRLDPAGDAAYGFEITAKVWANRPARETRLDRANFTGLVLGFDTTEDELSEVLFLHFLITSI